MIGIAVALAIALQRFNEAAVDANRLQNQGLYKQAEARYVEALSFAERLGDRCHPRALTMNNLGANQYRTGRFVEAAASYGIAIAIWREMNRPGDTASALSNLAELMMSEGKPDQALRSVREALALQDRTGRRNPNSLLVYASALRATGHGNEAATLLRKMLRELGGADNRPSSLPVWTALAQTELSLGEYSGAHASAQRAIEIAAADGGAQSQAYGFSVFLRGRARQAEGNFSEAERDIQESLRIHEKYLGPDHPKLAPILGDLADLLGHRGRNEEALGHIGRALVITQQKFGVAHQDYAALLLASAHQLRAMVQPEAAAARFDEALRRAEAAYGTRSSSLAPYFGSYGAALFDLGRMEEAEQHLRTAIVLYESAPGGLSPGLADNLHSMAVLTMRAGRLDESKVFLERTLAVRQHFHGAAHESLIRPLQDYALVLERQGHSKRAKQMTARANAIAGSLPEYRHRVSVDSLRTFR